MGEQFSRSGRLDVAQTDPAQTGERATRKPPLSRYARAAERGEASAPHNRDEPLVSAQESSTGAQQAAPETQRVARDELLPVPSSAPTRIESNPRRPFWKRLTLHRPAPPPPTLSLDPVLRRFDELERSLIGAQRATEQRLDRFEENITRLWELEEQIGLTEVSERLALLEAAQVELADAIHSLSRNVWVGAIVLAGIASLAALAVILLP